MSGARPDRGLRPRAETSSSSVNLNVRYSTIATKPRRNVYRRPPAPVKPPLPGTEPPPIVRTTVASINLSATKGREGLTVGDHVRIVGSGLYNGEAAVIEKLPGGVIPTALVRTEAGRTRQVRTIDLEPIP